MKEVVRVEEARIVEVVVVEAVTLIRWVDVEVTGMVVREVMLEMRTEVERRVVFWRIVVE